MIQGKEAEEEGSCSRFMNFVKEFGVVVNEEDEDDLSKHDETGIGSPTSGEEIREAQSLKEQTTNHRKNVEEGLKNRRDKKLSSKLSMDTQLLNISKEDLSLKRKLVEQLEKSEEDFN